MSLCQKSFSLFPLLLVLPLLANQYDRYDEVETTESLNQSESLMESEPLETFAEGDSSKIHHAEPESQEFNNEFNVPDSDDVNEQSSEQKGQRYDDSPENHHAIYEEGN